MDNTTPIGIVITALLSAIAWLAKRLYDCPRPSDWTRIVAENDKLRAAADAAAVEARRLYEAREVELRALEVEVAALRAGAERIERRRADER